MSGANPTAQSLIMGALQDLGQMGAAESAPTAEDAAFGLVRLNQLIGQKNARKRNSWFQKSVSFPFAVAQASYTIGPTGDFVTTTRPENIQFAQLVLTNQSPPVQIDLAILQVEQYQQIPIPRLASEFPLMIYYAPEVPNGKIYPYPAFPSEVTFELNLTWWNLMDTIALADILTDLILPSGYERALQLNLAVNMYPAFAKRSDIDELRRQMREAWSDANSNNVPPPRISSTDGVTNGPMSFDWRSRSFV